MKKLLVMFLSFIFVCIVNRSKMGWDNNSFSDCVAALGAFTVRKCPVFQLTSLVYMCLYSYLQFVCSFLRPSVHLYFPIYSYTFFLTYFLSLSFFHSLLLCFPSFADFFHSSILFSFHFLLLFCFFAFCTRKCPCHLLTSFLHQSVSSSLFVPYFLYIDLFSPIGVVQI